MTSLPQHRTGGERATTVIVFIVSTVSGSRAYPLQQPFHLLHWHPDMRTPDVRSGNSGRDTISVPVIAGIEQYTDTNRSC
jgi:hypothetical protein